MIRFIRAMLSGTDGEASSKRGIMFLLVITFLFVIIYNQQTGKDIDHDLKDQLYKLIGLIIILVFGEKAIDAWKTVKGKSDDLPKI